MGKNVSGKSLDHKDTIDLENINYSEKKRLDLNDLLRRNKDIKKHNTIQNLIIFAAVIVIFSILALTYIFIKF